MQHVNFGTNEYDVNHINIIHLLFKVDILIQLDFGGFYGFTVKQNGNKIGACKYYLREDDDDLSYGCLIKVVERQFYILDVSNNKRRYAIIKIFREIMLKKLNRNTVVNLRFEPFSYVMYENTSVKFKC